MNIFCQSVGPPLYRGSIVADFRLLNDYKIVRWLLSDTRKHQCKLGAEFTNYKKCYPPHFAQRELASTGLSSV